VGPLAVIDLETTGLAEDPGAEILELGAVLIEPGAPQLTVLRSLVRPSRPLPRVVERLTGLTDDDVAGAPAIAEVARPLSDALAGRTLIAHNADFERRFLARFVSRELGEARYLDTLDLLALTHPDAPDLRLESFTRRLLGSEERHRALDDALDTTRVLVRVALGASGGERRYATARLAIARFAPDSAWGALLGDAPAIEVGGDGAQFVEVGDSSESPVPFDEDAIAAALADQTRGRRHLPGYRVRREQIELARQFARNLADGGSISSCRRTSRPPPAFSATRSCVRSRSRGGPTTSANVDWKLCSRRGAIRACSPRIAWRTAYFWPALAPGLTARWEPCPRLWCGGFPGCGSSCGARWRFGPSNAVESSVPRGAIVPSAAVGLRWPGRI